MERIWGRSRSLSSGRTKKKERTDDLYGKNERELQEMRDRARMEKEERPDYLYGKNERELQEMRDRARRPEPNAPAYQPRIGLEMDDDGDYVMLIYHGGARADVECSSRGPIKLKSYGGKERIPIKVSEEVMKIAEERWESVIRKLNIVLGIITMCFSF